MEINELQKDTKLTKKDRMLKAFRNTNVPDRVPVSPDISNGIPARYSKKNFWEIFYEKNPPIWDAYLDVSDNFDFEVCLEAPGLLGTEINNLYCGGLLINTIGNVDVSNQVLIKNEKMMDIKYSHHTKKGDLFETIRFPVDNPPWHIEPLVKDIGNDLKKLFEIITIDPFNKSPNYFKDIYNKVGDRGIVETRIQVPTSWWFFNRVDMTRSIMDYYDYEVQLRKIMNAYREYAIEEVKACCELLGADAVVFGGCNASMSVISPKMYREFNLPFIEEATMICKKNKVVSRMHVGGRSKEILEMIQHTDLDVIEPLERPPSGNINLAEVKKKYGKKLCLKGNVNTFETLGSGSSLEVKLESLNCIHDAGQDGGFILSSGDQVPINTPYKNIKIMVETAKKYGKYPLDLKLIKTTIDKIARKLNSDSQLSKE